ncbi:hypothetical protein LX87_04511 [Larkinella arboricola]|uniref:Uncharacterized protein n=1 Tax=Larkinella arboricola TaxID=643671 RepID=A0A327WM34_LARAB|nr:hypothetical protein [Larkinella arboricola]RAJ92999.1 hypothetical protein LX87_04511 [Larkinella arboricola]
MLSSRIITQADEQVLFSCISYRLSFGTAAELDYLHHSSIRVFYHPDASDTFLAGYTINSQGPFRYLSVLESMGLAETTLAKTDISPTNVAEIGCLWMEKSGLNASDCIQIYTMALADLLQTGKNWLMAGSLIHKYQVMLEWFFTTTLFSGPVQVRTQTDEAKIYAIERSEVLGRFLKSMVRLLIRSRKRRKR